MGRDVLVRQRQFVALLLVSAMVLSSIVQWDQPGTVDRPTKALPNQAPTGKSGATPSVSTLSSLMGTSFIENGGQIGNPEVLYYAQGDPLSVGFTCQGLVYTILEPCRNDGQSANGDATARRSISFHLGFDDSRDAIPEGAMVLPHPTNFFKGADPSEWVKGARSYAEVRYTGLYPGVDLRFYFKGGMLKYDLDVQPWADADRIVLHYEGVTSLGLDPQSGDLLIGTALGTIRDMRPVVMRTGLAEVGRLPGDYRFLGEGRVGFELPIGCPRDVPLTIDPGLEFATYIGGNLNDYGRGIAVDKDGNVIIGGETYSIDFPITDGAYCETGECDIDFEDMFVAKFNPTGSQLLFCTYIAGYLEDNCKEIAIGPDGGIYCAGSTRSLDDFPVTLDLRESGTGDIGRPVTLPADAMVLRLDPDGSNLTFSCLMGDVRNDFCQNIKLLPDGSIIVAGSTQGDIKTTAGAYCESRIERRQDFDLFIAKINRSLDKLDFCTYLGGTGYEGGGIDNVYDPSIFRFDFDIDVNGNLIVLTGTNSSDFPTTPGAYRTSCYNVSSTTTDLALAVLDPTGSRLLYSTYYGGMKADWANTVMAAPNGTIYIGGITESPDFPITPDALVKSYSYVSGLWAGYLAVFSKDLSSLLYSSYMTWSGDGVLSVQATTWSPDFKIAYLAGSTNSANLPTTEGTYDSEFRGGVCDEFIMGINVTDFHISYCTYFGGSLWDGGETRAIKELRSDPDGILYLVGTTTSPDLPTTIDAYCRQVKGIHDTFVLKLDPRPCTAPPMPTNLTAHPEDGRVNLTWDPPSGKGQRFLQHNLYWGTSPTDISNRITVSKSDHTTIHYGLQNGVDYYYQLSAYNKMGESPRTDMVMARPLGVPSVPRGFLAVNENGSIHLNWSAPSYIGAELIGYHLLKETMGVGTEQLDFGPEATAYDDYQVQAGVHYTYKIRGYNTLWNGTWTDPPQEVVPRTVPSAPLGLNATGKDRSVELAWKAPQSDGGSAIISYRIYGGTSRGGMQFLDAVPAKSPSYTATGLVNGFPYFFYVTAFNRIGDGPSSSIVEVTPKGPPSAPQQLVAVPGDGSVTLTWKPPVSDGGSLITHYKVYGGRDRASLKCLATVGTETAYVDLSLTNGITYFYQVLAMNALGEGPRCEVVEAMPIAPPGGVQDLTVVEGAGRLVLMWSLPIETGGQPLTAIRIYRAEEQGPVKLVRELGPSCKKFTDLNVTTGRQYRYDVVAVSIAGEGQPVTIRGIPFGAPGIPTGLSVTPGDGRVTVRWGPPDNDGGRPVTGYTVFRGEPGVPLRLLTELGNVLSYVDIEVVNGRTYGYVVKAVNEAGMGEASGAVEATPAKQIGVPGAVQSPRAEAKGGQVLLAWRPPASNGGSPITGYVIMRGAGPGNLTALAEVGVVLSYSDSAVERGRTYFYSVAAKNAAGQGERSGSAIEVKVPEKSSKDSPGVLMVTAMAALVLAGAVLRRRGKFGS